MYAILPTTTYSMESGRDDTRTTLKKQRVGWTDGQVDMLIKFWKKNYFALNSIRQREYWSAISEHVCAIGPARSGDECKEKMRNMISYYRRVRDGKDSNKSMPKYFDELESVLGPRGLIHRERAARGSNSADDGGIIIIKEERQTENLLENPDNQTPIILDSYSTASLADEIALISPTPTPDDEFGADSIFSLAKEPKTQKHRATLDDVINMKKRQKLESTSETQNDTKFGELLSCLKMQMEAFVSNSNYQRDLLSDMIKSQAEKEERQRQREIEMEERQRKREIELEERQRKREIELEERQRKREVEFEERQRDKDREFMLELAKVFKSS